MLHIASSNTMLKNHVYLTSIVSTNRANRLNITSIHQIQIYLVSFCHHYAYEQRTETYERSIGSMQILMVSQRS